MSPLVVLRTGSLKSGPYKLIVDEVEDLQKHTLSAVIDFYASPTQSSPVTPPSLPGIQLQIVEVAFTESGNDFIEFLVLHPGTLAGWKVYESGVLLKTFPDISLTQGERILLHVNGSSEADEVILDSSASIHSVAGVRDFWSKDTGLAATDVTVSLQYEGDISDSVSWSNQDGKVSAQTLDEALIQQGSPSGFKYGEGWVIPDVNRFENFSVSSKSAVSGISLQRISFQDTNTLSDWTLTGMTPGY
jgi:hypothetical protein